jgi:hypothetical protein
MKTVTAAAAAAILGIAGCSSIVKSSTATRVATAQLNARARPWIWGRPQPKHRSCRRRFIYTL